MRIMVTGSRRWPDTEVYRNVIHRTVRNWVNQGDTLVSGGAVGADRIAEGYARVLGAEIEVWKPEYDKHGKGAPLVRNIEMLESGVHLVLAFLYGNPEHGGTKHTIENAQKRGIRLVMCNWPER